MGRELCHLGVYHESLHTGNVLQVQATGIQGPCSPLNKKWYNYRFIDLEDVTIMETNEEYIMDQVEGRLNEIANCANFDTD